MIFPFLKFIFGRRRNLPRQCFFFNDDFFALLILMMLCVHAYIIFHLIVFFFLRPIEFLIQSTLALRTLCYDGQPYTDSS